MKVQNINQNNYQNNRPKDIGFKMQAHAACNFYCPNGKPCNATTIQIVEAFKVKASEAAAWENEKAMTVYAEVIGEKLDLLLIKFETWLKILNLKRKGNEADAKSILESIRNDKVHTLQLRMPIPTLCPNALIPAENLTRNIKTKST